MKSLGCMSAPAHFFLRDQIYARLQSQVAVNSQLCSDEPRHFGHQVRKPSSPAAVNGRKVDLKKAMSGHRPVSGRFPDILDIMSTHDLARYHVDT